MLWGVIVGTLIDHFGIVFECGIAMQESFWDEELMCVFGRQFTAKPGTKLIGASSEVDCNIKDSPHDNPDQLILCVRWCLEVETSNCS